MSGGIQVSHVMITTAEHDRLLEAARERDRLRTALSDIIRRIDEEDTELEDTLLIELRRVARAATDARGLIDAAGAGEKQHGA